MIQAFINICELFNKSNILPGMARSFKLGQNIIKINGGISIAFALN
jgi:hypothetical protein